MPKSVISEDLQPFDSCKGWIKENIHFCWTSAEAWELGQDSVCSLCVVHNRHLGAVERKPAQQRHYDRTCQSCNTQIQSDLWAIGYRICSYCRQRIGQKSKRNGKIDTTCYTDGCSAQVRRGAWEAGIHYCRKCQVKSESKLVAQ